MSHDQIMRDARVVAEQRRLFEGRREGMKDSVTRAQLYAAEDWHREEHGGFRVCPHVSGEGEAKGGEGMTPIIFIIYSGALIILGACLYRALEKVLTWPHPVPREIHAKEIRQVMKPDCAECGKNKNFGHYSDCSQYEYDPPDYPDSGRYNDPVDAAVRDRETKEGG